MAKLLAAQEVKLQALPVCQPAGALARETAGGLPAPGTALLLLKAMPDFPGAPGKHSQLSRP